jgi:RNA polymerase sigma-70 factor (ECF subfamily)
VLLLRAARFEVARRRRVLPHVRGGDFDDVANQAADDALVAVLARLDDFRGESRFTTWAYKFALLEAAVKLRRRAWQGGEIPLPEPGGLELLPGMRAHLEGCPACAEERDSLFELVAADDAGGAA